MEATRPHTDLNFDGFVCGGMENFIDTHQACRKSLFVMMMDEGLECFPVSINPI